MRKAHQLYILSAVVLIFVSSCSKKEGEGGKATIQGKVYNMLTDPNGKFLEKEEARDVDVFITYGDNDGYDDNTNTHYDGTYEFKYLRKGDYKIYAYSDCNTCPSQKKQVEVSVEISDKKGTTSALDIDIVKIIDIDDGSSTITGRVFMTDYTQIGVPTYYAPEERVYIVYNTDTLYFDDMRTNGNGEYAFNNLIEGSYMVYAFSDCISCSEGIEPVEINTQITAKGQTITLQDIAVDNR